MTTIDDVKRFNLKYFDESDGRLAPIEFHKDVPFEVKRMFYVYDVHDQNDRGKHSHHKTKQILIAVNGGDNNVAVGYGSAIGAAFGAIIFGTVSMGIFYTDVDTDWFKVFLGGMMLIAVIFNNFIRRRVTENK